MHAALTACAPARCWSAVEQHMLYILLGQPTLSLRHTVQSTTPASQPPFNRFPQRHPSKTSGHVCRSPATSTTKPSTPGMHVLHVSYHDNPPVPQQLIVIDRCMHALQKTHRGPNYPSTPCHTARPLLLCKGSPSGRGLPRVHKTVSVVPNPDLQTSKAQMSVP